MALTLKEHSASRTHVTGVVLMAKSTRFVLVEGESDARFLSPRLAGRARATPIDGGRAAVQEAHSFLENHGASNYVALVDADFNEVLGLNESLPRMVYVSISADTADSTIDLESTLLRTRALRQLCGQHLGNHIQDLGGPAVFTNTIREALRAAAAAVGAYRAAVMSFFADRKAIQGIGEVTDSEWERFVDLETGAIDASQLEEMIKTRVQNTIKYPQVKALARDCSLNAGHGWLLCRGHDMTQLLALRLSHISGRRIDQRTIEDKLLASFKGNLFTDTTFGQQLIAFCCPSHAAATPPMTPPVPRGRFR